VADKAAEVLERAVQAALVSSRTPWTTTARRVEDDSWIVELTHDASNGFIIETGTADPAAAARRVVDSLGRSREIERVAAAPPLRHVDAVRGLRAVVQTFGWSRAEVRAMARLLEELGALDADEAVWLASHVGADRPPPRATEAM
jgi:threonine synthase